MLPTARKRLDERQAVEARQHAIDDEDVEGLVHGAGKTVAPVRHLLGHVPRLGEPVQEVGGGLGIVLDDKDAHRSPFAGRELKTERKQDGLQEDCRPITEP